MKIESKSIRSTANQFQQESNATEAAKTKTEVLPDAKTSKLDGQLAANIHSEQAFSANIRANELQKTVAQLRTSPHGIKQAAESISAHFNTESQLKSLTEQLESLRDQKQGLMTQIQSVMTQIQGAQLAGNSQLVAQGMAQLQELKSQLAEVDVKIKDLMNEIQKLTQQQQGEQDRAKQQEESNNKLQSNLDKTADTYNSILDLLK